MTVDRCEHVDMACTVTELENERQVPNEENDLQLQVTEMFQGMHVSVELDGLEWALQPQLSVIAAGPSRVEEEEGVAEPPNLMPSQEYLSSIRH